MSSTSRRVDCSSAPSSSSRRSKRRYYAARAVWRLGDLTAVSIEMEKVRAEAEREGDSLTEALALTALADAVLQTERRHGARRAADRARARAPGGRDGRRRAFRLALRPRVDRHRAGEDGRRPSVYRAGVLDRARRGPQGSPDDRRAGACPGAHRPARARRGRTAGRQGARACARERKPTRPRLDAAHARLAAADAWRPRRRRAGVSRGARAVRGDRSCHACSRPRSHGSRMSPLERGDLPQAEKRMREAIRLLAPLAQHAELAEVAGGARDRARRAGQGGRGGALHRGSRGAGGRSQSRRAGTRSRLREPRSPSRRAARTKPRRCTARRSRSRRRLDFTALEADALRTARRVPRRARATRRSCGLRGAARRARARRRARPRSPESTPRPATR